jgi:peptidoglycan hydrolase-like protein with peptidoglycan-binding domain
MSGSAQGIDVSSVQTPLTAADLNGFVFAFAWHPTTRESPARKSSHSAKFSVHRLQALIAVTGQINNLAAASAVSADGNFGPTTQAGLMAIQQYYTITVSGMADEATWTVLVAGTP